MKHLLSFALIIFFSVSAAAQDKTPFAFLKSPSKSSLTKEIESLRNALDSMQIVLDSLQERKYLEESEVLAVLEGNEGEDETIQYSQEVTDSLLHEWYSNIYANSTDVEYDMDSIRFTSNVSDTEMIRRLEEMNSFITLPFNETVKNYMILYAEKMPTQMSRVLGLSQYYFPIFEEALGKYDLPYELKYMSVIESMLNARATSRAGARGMWQFMYNTGRIYGLEINSFVDERLDVAKAADAAARYLADAYKIFGDWALAISSYNCGAGNVSKAIRRAGGSRDFWSIYPFLPRETRGYMPAFVGAMYAMTYAREYGLTPMNVGMPAQTDTIHITRNLHLQQLHEAVGIPMEDLRNLNPQYTHDIVPGNTKTYILNVAYNWTGPLLDVGIDSVYRFKADSLMSEKVIKDVQAASTSQRVAYRVKSGDYLGKIASKYGVSVSKLKAWNNLKSNNIRVGQLLYIYKGGAAPSSETPKTTSTSSGKRYYTVKSGDSLYTIAKHFPGVSADNIKEANNLGNSSIKPGQNLEIPYP